MIDIHSSPVRQFLNNKTIFITGGFGFVGKILIEKLLRCEVKRIYLLARSKKGKSMQERLENFVQDPVRNKFRRKLELLLIPRNSLKGFHTSTGKIE